MNPVYIVAVIDSNGAPDIMYGPFDTSDEAAEWIARYDEFLADVEKDVAKDELARDPSTITDVDTVVWVINPTDQFKEIS